jgi:hypothetical protein
MNTWMANCLLTQYTWSRRLDFCILPLNGVENGDIPYLKAEDEVEGDVEGEEEHLQDVLQDVHLVDHARPLQGHAHLGRDQFFK